LHGFSWSVVDVDAHEFFHAIQYRYDYDDVMGLYATKNRWWVEASATWAGDEVYDGVNYYKGFLKHYFDNPHWSLNLSSSPFITVPQFSVNT